MRNNVEKSKAGHVRLLRKGTSEQHIEWQFFKKAYDLDQKKSTFKIHEKLTEEHFSLGYANKMRNHLACDVLDKNMLFLMKVGITSLKLKEKGMMLVLTCNVTEKYK